MSARAIESGEGNALGSLLPELLSEGECPWESSRGWVARSLGFLGSGLVLPPGALGPSRLFPLGLSLLLCAVRTPSSPLVLGLPLSVFSLVHLQAPLAPLSSASPEFPSLHQRFWGLQEKVEGAVWGLFPSCPPRCVLPHYFFLPEEEEPSQSTNQASDGSSPGKAPQGPHQGPDGSGSDLTDPPKSKGSNFYHYAGKVSLSTNPQILTPHPLLSSTC